MMGGLIIIKAVLLSMWDLMRAQSKATRSCPIRKPSYRRRIPLLRAAQYAWLITEAPICYGCCPIAAICSTSSALTHGWDCIPRVQFVERLRSRRRFPRRWLRWFRWPPERINSCMICGIVILNLLWSKVAISSELPLLLVSPFSFFFFTPPYKIVMDSDFIWYKLQCMIDAYAIQLLWKFVLFDMIASFFWLIESLHSFWIVNAAGIISQRVGRSDRIYRKKGRNISSSH